eukprot:gene14405-18382_t
MFGILLTYGAVVPPIAVTGCVALWSLIYQFEIMVG